MFLVNQRCLTELAVGLIMDLIELSQQVSKMNDKQVNLSLKPQEFFREQLLTAQSQLKTSLDDDLSFYIVNLLVEFISPPQLPDESADSTTNVMDYPLVLLLKRAMESPPRQQYQILKHLGDSSLYVSGFFQDYFNRKTFDIDYYITMGRSAYNHVSSLSNVRVYRNLSENFNVCVELLSCVSDTPGLKQNKELLGVYERWHKTQSTRLYRILVEAGITPIPSDKKSAS